MSEETSLPREDYPLLYVDDEQDNLVVFKASLGDEFRILTARSGEEALELLESEDIALVLADQRMPGMSGIDLCEQIRLHHPNVRRVLITAFSDQQTAMDAINRGGVHGFLMKPWDDLELRQVLTTHLERVHLERVVSSLRGAIAENERQLGLATMRDRILHDLGGVTFRLGLLCTQLERAVVPGAGTPEQQLENVRKGLQKMRRAIDHLVTLHSERRSWSTEQNRERLRLAEVFEMVKVLSGIEHLPGFRLSIDTPAEATVYADRVSLTRVLVNLISNALEAMESRGGARGRVWIEVIPGESGYTNIEISDDGPGIPADQRERIFEERFSTKKQTGGTGIGLSSSRSLAEANGGQLELIPSERGARFRLRLPTWPAVARSASAWTTSISEDPR